MLQDVRAAASTDVNIEFRFGEVTERRVEVNTGCQRQTRSTWELTIGRHTL